MPHGPGPPLARTSAALAAVANARPGAGLVALILALLLRLLARTEPAWLLPQDEEYEDEHGFDAYAACGANPYALHPRPVGRAPHAACIEAGLVPDWILPGIRNRGMRPHAMAATRRRHALAARAPPRALPIPR
jgi:hypothetical protein